MEHIEAYICYFDVQVSACANLGTKSEIHNITGVIVAFTCSNRTKRPQYKIKIVLNVPIKKELLKAPLFNKSLVILAIINDIF